MRRIFYCKLPWRIIRQFHNNNKDHEAKCPLQQILCPHGCQSLIKRQEQEKHYEAECKNKILECEFKEFGCEISVMFLFFGLKIVEKIQICRSHKR
jgi:TRAF-type zinc finger